MKTNLAIDLEETSVTGPDKDMPSQHRGLTGHLKNVGLAAFSQLLALERQTCILDVQSAAAQARLFFVNGELWDAVVGQARGEEAAIEILGWEVADVTTASLAHPVPRRIEASLTFLLIEAMRRQDERDRDLGDAGNEAPEQAAPLSITAEDLATILLTALSQELDGFLAASVADVATGSSISSLALPGTLDPELAGSFCCDILRQELELIEALHLGSSLEDLTLTFSDQIHLIKLASSSVFLYLVVDSGRTRLPLLRSVVQRHWTAFEAGIPCEPVRPEAVRRT